MMKTQNTYMQELVYTVASVHTHNRVKDSSVVTYTVAIVNKGTLG